MSMSAWRRAGVSLTAAIVIAGVAGCQGGEKKAAEGAPKAEAGSGATVTQVLTAAYKKVAAVKSAKVHMTMEMPAGADGGTVEMSGTMGWNPTVLDVTVKGQALQAAPNAPEQVRTIMMDNVMYMDLGAEASAEMDGKRWMKMDLAAIAKTSGNPAAQNQITRGLEDMNQDPAQQLAVLVESPNVKRVGEEKIAGVATQHYKGSVSVGEMVAANDSLAFLTDEQRKALLANVKKSGITGYDTEVWVNEAGYPVRMNVDMVSAKGKITMVADYSDYGSAVAVKAPPAAATFDLMEMLKGIAQDTKSAT